MKKASLIFLMIVICNSSCIKKIVMNSVGVFDKSIKPGKFSNGIKEVVFFPVHHIGTKQFYSDARKKVDSLKNLGFTFYYEGVKESRTSDSLISDTINRKMRKLLGIDLKSFKSKGGYIDTVNHTFLGLHNKYIKKYGLVNQRYSDMGINAGDKWVDVFLQDIVNDFEEHFGIIKLSQCDFDTKLGSKYFCKHFKRKKSKKSILDFRNHHIVEKILSDTATKIAILYGAEHGKGIFQMLQDKDKSWKKVD